ncbi:MAG: putative phage abortive infection protein [Sulfurovum sp.]
MTYIGAKILLIIILLIIGGSILNKFFEDNKLIKYMSIIALFVFIHMLTTAISPSYTFLSLFALDDINSTASTTDLWAIRGQIGDVLAGHFTALAVLGLMITILQMKKSIEIQKNAFNEQSKEMKKQSFENKFFQMLGLFDSLVENQYHKDTITKKELLRKLREQIKEDILGYDKYGFNFFPIDTKQDFDRELQNTLEKFNNNDNYINFKYYFINLYQIIKFVDDTFTKDATDKNETSEEKIYKAKQYTNLIRAKLSKDELVLLFYNAYMVQGFSGSGYKEYVEKYSFFKHLRYEDIITDSDHHIVDLLFRQYKRDAFDKNDALKKKWDELNGK